MDEVVEYFNSKAKNYENETSKPYWRFCDEIIWECIKQELDLFENTSFSVVDLGGGSGFWTRKIKERYPYCKVTICDNSISMLNEARHNLENFDDVVYKLMDITESDKFTKQFDVCLCIYVSMFINKQEKLFRTISNVMKNDGKLFYIAQNIYHTMAMVISNNQVDRLSDLLINQTVRITPKHPQMYFLDRKDILMLAEKYTFKVNSLGSFPKFCRAGIREKMTSEKYSISEVLREKNNFLKLKKLELDYLFSNNLDNGMYYILVASKKTNKEGDCYKN